MFHNVDWRFMEDECLSINYRFITIISLSNVRLTHTFINFASI